jgi:hypothetical protein
MERRPFSRPAELAALGIIDFRRLHGYWRTREQALAYLGGLLCGAADYVVYDVPDFGSCPRSDDWPGWAHVGNHPAIGRKLWDWFRFHLPHYTLVLDDQPDFRAWAPGRSGIHFVRGDIGKVSPQAFAFALNGVRPGDLWISILNGGRTHVAITFLDGIRSKVPPRKRY